MTYLKLRWRFDCQVRVQTRWFGTRLRKKDINQYHQGEANIANKCSTQYESKGGPHCNTVGGEGGGSLKKKDKVSLVQLKQIHTINMLLSQSNVQFYYSDQNLRC